MNFGAVSVVVLTISRSRCHLWLHESDPADETAPRSLQMARRADGTYVNGSDC